MSMEHTPDCLPWCRVDGNTTLGENMADHGGLSMALEAYTTWRRTNRDVRLPALPFNDMQLFFLGYALPWCARHTDKHSAHQILNDEHAPERCTLEIKIFLRCQIFCAQVPRPGSP